MNSYDKLQYISNANNSLLCVGLDTDINKIPGHLGKDISAILEFNKQIIDATKDIVSSYKINFAFYEQYGIEGFDILKKTFDYIPENIFTIADAKRGDIGNTSKAYAKSCFEYFNADSITVNPFMGRDSVMPFLDYSEKLVFLLGLTSNPGSNDFQRLLSNGNPVYKHVFEISGKWAGKEQLGYVVGATHPDELAELRKMMPGTIFLIPGIGAQGGDIKATLQANAHGPAVINASRAVIYASQGKDFAEKAAETALSLKNEFNKYIK